MKLRVIKKKYFRVLKEYYLPRLRLAMPRRKEANSWAHQVAKKAALTHKEATK